LRGRRHLAPFVRTSRPDYSYNIYNKADAMIYLHETGHIKITKHVTKPPHDNPDNKRPLQIKARWPRWPPQLKPRLFVQILAKKFCGLQLLDQVACSRITNAKGVAYERVTAISGGADDLRCPVRTRGPKSVVRADDLARAVVPIVAACPDETPCVINLVTPLGQKKGIFAAAVKTRQRPLTGRPSLQVVAAGAACGVENRRPVI
jgi:hypothetical protein